MQHIQVRPARSEDKEAVLAFCQHTWPDHDDYIADVWDEWLADQHGCLFVVLWDGQPAAVDHVALVSDQEAWWEGLRVDPDYRGRGLVAALRPHLRAYTRASGAEVVRMAITSENTISLGMAQRSGFRRVGRYVLHQAPAGGQDDPLLMRLDEAELDLVWTFLKASRQFADVGRLYVSHRWVWQQLTSDRLAGHLAQGDVWGLRRSPSRLDALAILTPPQGDFPGLWVGYADGGPAHTAPLLSGLQRLASIQGKPVVGGHFPVQPALLDALAGAGYQRAMSAEVWVFEARLDELTR